MSIRPITPFLCVCVCIASPYRIASTSSAPRLANHECRKASAALSRRSAKYQMRCDATPSVLLLTHPARIRAAWKSSPRPVEARCIKGRENSSSKSRFPHASIPLPYPFVRRNSTSREGRGERASDKGLARAGHLCFTSILTFIYGRTDGQIRAARFATEIKRPTYSLDATAQWVGRGKSAGGPPQASHSLSDTPNI